MWAQVPATKPTESPAVAPIPSFVIYCKGWSSLSLLKLILLPVLWNPFYHLSHLTLLILVLKPQSLPTCFFLSALNMLKPAITTHSNNYFISLNKPQHCSQLRTYLLFTATFFFHSYTYRRFVYIWCVQCSSPTHFLICCHLASVLKILWNFSHSSF